MYKDINVSASKNVCAIILRWHSIQTKDVSN